MKLLSELIFIYIPLEGSKQFIFILEERTKLCHVLLNEKMYNYERNFNFAKDIFKKYLIYWIQKSKIHWTNNQWRTLSFHSFHMIQLLRFELFLFFMWFFTEFLQ